MENSIINLVPPENNILKFIGKYQLLKLIAVGGMAEIYKAQIPGDDRFVIVKKIHSNYMEESNFLRMFFDEAKILANLKNEHIVSILDFGKSGNDYFIVLEYIDGKNLRILIDRCLRMSVVVPIPIAIFITAKILKGISYAHNKTDRDGNKLNIIHRDVSPDNILISWDGDVKIIDFGIAKCRASSTVTKVGQLKGKLGYMSPEQVFDDEVDERTDIYSTGAILYELVTGEKLFKYDINGSFKDRFKKFKPIPPRKINANIPKELEKVILKALARKPDDRYNTAEEFRLALIDAIGVTNYKQLSRFTLSQLIKTLFPSEYRKSGSYNLKRNLMRNTESGSLKENESFFVNKTKIRIKNQNTNTERERPENTITYLARQVKAKKRFNIDFPALFKRNKELNLGRFKVRKSIIIVIALLVFGALFMQTDFNAKVLLKTFVDIPDQYHLIIGDYYLNSKDYNRAYTHYMKMDDEYLKREDVSLKMAHIFINSLPKEKAVPEAKKLLMNSSPLRAKIFRQLGDYYVNASMNDAARDSYIALKELSANPDDLSVANKYLDQYEQEKNKQTEDEQKKVYQEKIAQKEEVEKSKLQEKRDVMKKFSYHISRGDSFSDDGSHSSAIKEYRNAIGISPDSSLAYAKLGISQSKNYEIEKAIVSLNKSIGLDENSKLAYKELGKIYYEMGELSKALSVYRRYIKLENDNQKKELYENIVVELERELGSKSSSL